MQRITFISHSESFYSTRRLMEAASQLGLHVSRLDPVRVVIQASNGGGTEGLAIYEDQVAFPTPDLVMPRIGTLMAPWSLSLLDVLVLKGAKSALSSQAIRTAGDKLQTALALSAHALPSLATFALREPFHARDIPSLLPSSRWVLKTNTGSGGTGVCLTDSATSTRSVLGALTANHQIVLAQPFSDAAKGRDLRVLVAGEQPLFAYWRKAKGDEFRANVHLGGQVEKAVLSADVLDLALKAARAVGLPFAGVDLIETDSGFAVLEVNASPGLQGAEEAAGCDLATPFLQAYLDYLA